MQENDQLTPINFNSDNLNIREEIEKYVFHWKWFVLGLIIALSGAYTYLRYVPNQYSVETSILINDDKKGGLSSELSAFEDLGLLGGGKASIDNEIELLKSRTLMEDVVKDLGLNVTYFTEGRVIKSELFQENVPVKINFLEKNETFYTLTSSFKIEVISKTVFRFKESDEDGIEKNFGETVNTSFGEIIVTPVDLSKFEDVKEIIVHVTPIASVINRYKKAVQIQPINKSASVIKLSLIDPVKIKAQTILDRLVAKYNENTVEDKSVISQNTNKFISKRLEVISEELTIVDKGVEQFKSKNKLTDLVSEAGLIVGTNADIEGRIIELNTQLKLADFVNEYITSNSKELIPANLGLADASANENSLKYNELLLERNRILKSSSELNPVIVNLDDQISKLRFSIFQSLKNLKSSLTISLNELKKQENRLNSKITAVPKQEREFRDIQRQQQIIETLYLYLLQKREENAIALAVTAPNAKVIDIAYGSDLPMSPKRRIVYLAAALLGLLIPFVVLYLMFLLDNKVHSKSDIESIIKAPILGEIPKTKSENKLVVTENDRDSIAESFRMLRTNINFMLSSVKEGGKTIFITSTVPGEGKTFISLNIATVLALSNKKVLLIGADVRKPKIHEYLGVKFDKGLTQYLMDDTVKVSQTISYFPEGNFDVLGSGIVPPNPSELLMNGRFDEVLAYGKEHYDYVIVDTAPVKMVTDTMLLGHHADLCLYIIRANYLDNRLLEIPERMYNEKRLPNMAVVLNDVDLDRGYGYGYGYGYGEGEPQKPWWKRLLS